MSSNLAVALQTLVSHFIHGLTQVRHHVGRCFYEDEDDGDEDGDDDDDDDEDGDDDEQWHHPSTTSEIHTCAH